MRRWAYQVTRRRDSLRLVVMATPEDIKANAEYVRLADDFVHVPGGANKNNFNNIDLIVKTAIQCEVDAVWPGWGHASENPRLPRDLDAAGIVFMGPPASAIDAVGDKIRANLLAQSNRVNVIPWSGTGLTLEGTTVPPETMEAACVHSAEEALASAQRIGYPIMVKASEGGGGKGIRMVHTDEECVNGYNQVIAEVIGSPVFLQKLSQRSRHLEVQVLADAYGTAVHLYSRDCSVQRRHQKIIEEGPVVVAPADVRRELEDGAVRLCEAVGYRSAGTVEYLYNGDEYSFLEVNPRLQVEHPVTESITGINIPACQLQVAMGIPLHRIADVRAYYGCDREGDDVIDFSNTRPNPPLCHCMAARITAEDPEEGFKPSSGRITELAFRSQPNVSANFSISTTGEVHQFADSQFGHVFACGRTRDDANRLLVHTLSELTIRGEIANNVKYVANLLERPEFVANEHDTAWLDGLIATKHKPKPVPPQVAVLCGAIVQAVECTRAAQEHAVGVLARGVSPSAQELRFNELIFELIYNDVKYRLRVTRGSADSFSVWCNGALTKAHVVTLADGGFLVLVDGQSHKVYENLSKVGKRIMIDGAPCFFPDDLDPSCLVATSAGKLVEYLVPDGGKVAAGQPYANMEAMKMILPLVAGVAGTINHKVAPGSAIDLGETIAKLDLEDPSKVKLVPMFDGQFPALAPRRSSSKGAGEVQNLADAFVTARESLTNLMRGEDVIGDPFSELMTFLSDPRLAVQMMGEQVELLAATLPDAPARELMSLQRAAASTASTLAESKYGRKGLGEDDISLIVKSYKAFLAKHADAAPLAIVEGMEAVLDKFQDGFAVFGTGVLCSLLQEYLDVETAFSGLPLQDAMLALREAHADDLSKAVEFGYSHMSLNRKNALVVEVLIQLADMTHVLEVAEIISSLTALEGSAYSDVVQAANKALLAAEGQQRDSDRKWKSLQEHFKMSLDLLKDIQSDDEDANSPRIRVRPKSSESKGVVPPHGEGNGRKHLSICTSMSLDDLVSSNSSDDCEVDSAISRVGRSTRQGTRVKKSRHTSDSIMHAVQISEAVRDHDFRKDRQPMQAITWTSLFDDSNTQKRVSTVKFWFKQYHAHDITCEPRADSLCVKFNGDKVVMHMVKGVEQMIAVLSSDNFVNHRLLGFTLNMPGMRARSFDELNQHFERILREHTPKGWAYGTPGIVYVTVAEEGVAPTHLYFTVTPVEEASDKGPTTVAPLPGLMDIDPVLAAHYEISRLSGFSYKNISNMASSGKCPAGTRKEFSFMAKSADYHIGVFLGEELAPVKTAGMHDRRVFLRAAVYNKAIFLEEKSLSSLPAASAGHARSLSAVFDRKAQDGSRPRLLAAGKSTALRKTRLLKGSRTSYSSLSTLKARDPPADPMAEDDSSMPRSRSANEGFDDGGDKWLGLREDSILRDILDHLKLTVPVTETAWNHVFVNMIDSTPEDAHSVEQVVRTFTDEYAYDLHANKVANIEVKCGNARIVASNPTGLSWQITAAMAEAPSGAATVPGYDAKLEPYPVLNKVERKRMRAQNVNSTYVYDFIELFAQCARSVNIVDMDETDDTSSLFSAKELVLTGGPDGELDEIVREPGMNNVAMVAWECKVRTDDYPNGRDFILVASDITHLSGSFAPAEDNVYKAAFDRAIARGIPVVYIAANSGARIGLDEKVKAAFRVAWVDDKDPSKGFRYLYLSEGDYERLSEGGRTFTAERIEEEGQVRWKLVDVYGGVGVECLQGSGTIASVTSKARAETTTLTYVTGRSVGIGAYVARLGQRVIQHAQAPLVLTGASALNKLLGREVYSSNDQIGGPKVMGNNGVSNLVVNDDVEGVQAILEWLSYVPERRGAPLPWRLPRDPSSRELIVVPSRAPSDPRTWVRDFFDRGSFTECLIGWGKTVVCGRARLGGTPIGAIAVETRLTEKVVPADPGFEGSQRQVEQQAGTVWFPDSACKTAQMINDLNEEGLPLMMFANFRGFAGGLRDMFGEILKYGSYIVDALRTFRQPVFVYVPHEGELRGGAWVVIDPAINPEMMEMYAAETCRAGVLEPEGIVDIKFRKPDLMKAMHRNDPSLDLLPKEAREKREQELMPLYKNVSVAFAAMHDTPGVMLQKGAIREVVPWKQSRQFFITRLRKRLAIDAMKRAVIAAWPSAPTDAVQRVLDAHADTVEMLSTHVQGPVNVMTPELEADVAAVRAEHIKATVVAMCNEDAGAVRAAIAAADLL